MGLGYFTYCCGCGEVGGFEITVEAVKAQLEDAMKSAKAANRGALIATTISSQRAAVTALKDMSFLPVAKFRNPNTHGTNVTLWYRPLSEAGVLLAKVKHAFT
jgi:hypothetical protein